MGKFDPIIPGDFSSLWIIERGWHPSIQCQTEWVELRRCTKSAVLANVAVSFMV